MLTPTAIRSSVMPVPAVPLPMPPHDTAQAESLAEAMQLRGAIMSYPRNAEIFAEDEPADYLYQVVCGSVRTYNVLSDGRRQIGEFYLPGDIFGLQCGDKCPFSAEAMTDAKVRIVKRSSLHALAERDPSIARELFVLTSRELMRMHKRLLLLIKSAQERVASFLLEMAERVPSNPDIELPMSRQDIADYLGMTIETVSRTFTALEAAATIEVPSSRHIVLRNRPALNRLNG
jgi:CRP/FNR family transcriptional regulator, nitrogen fixation regulation protein